MTITVVPNIKRAEANGIICVQLDIHLWSGRKRLRKEGLIATNPALANLPPESLATLGSIKIADPDDLSPFMTCKREAEKLLRLNGLPLLGTWGIPEAKLEKVYRGLKLIQDQFQRRVQQLHSDFDARIDEWRKKDENKGWAHLITDIPTPEYVAGRLSLGFHLCRVSAPSADDQSEVNALYGKQVTGLKGELFKEASEEARTLMEKYLMGRDNFGVVQKREKITQKTLGPLRRIGEKFNSFGFLDPTVEPLARMVEHVLSLMPPEGPIDGVHLMHIWTLAKTLSSQTSMLEAAQLVMDSDSAPAAFESIVTSTTKAVPAVPAVTATVDFDLIPASGPIAPEADPLLASVSIPDISGLNEFQPQFVGLF